MLGPQKVLTLLASDSQFSRLRLLNFRNIFCFTVWQTLLSPRSQIHGRGDDLQILKMYQENGKPSFAMSCVLFSWKGELEGMEGDRARCTKVMINIYESSMNKDSRMTKPQNKSI